MDIKLIPISEQDGRAIFFPEELPIGEFISMRLLEKHTESGKTAVAWLIEFPEEIHAKRVMVKATAKIADGMLGAVRGACLKFGDWDNYKDKMEFENQMVASFVASMTDEQRVELFSKYCKHCGSDDPGCQCMNDE